MALDGLADEVVARLAVAGVDVAQWKPAGAVAIVAVGDAEPGEAASILDRSQIGWSHVQASELCGVPAGQLIVIDRAMPTGAPMQALSELAEAGRVVMFRPSGLRLDPPRAKVALSADELLAVVDAAVPRDVVCEPRCEALRVRRFDHATGAFYVFHNAGEDPVDSAVRLGATGKRFALDPASDAEIALGSTIRMVMPAGAWGVIRVSPQAA